MGNFLDKIQDPSEIRELNTEQMRLLAAELREEIISGVSKKGGHLSSNLGVIELTIALMARFNFDGEDQIVWDVGHQSYAYKLLSGRRDFFESLRDYQGYSGFSKRLKVNMISSTQDCDTSIWRHLGFES